jgi:hypothetical protein
MRLFDGGRVWAAGDKEDLDPDQQGKGGGDIEEMRGSAADGQQEAQNQTAQDRQHDSQHQPPVAAPLSRASVQPQSPHHEEDQAGGAEDDGAEEEDEYDGADGVGGEDGG